MANELYKALEITPVADSHDIKKAYFRLVRKYSPEKEPEKFQQIRRAYETLRDTKARANYDSLQAYGKEIERLELAANQYIEQNDWESAAEAYEEMLQYAPELDWALNRLGLCYDHLQNWDKAQEIYGTLTTQSPDVAVYWSNHGIVVRNKAEINDDKEALKLAKELFIQAKELEPSNPNHYIELAKCDLWSEDYEGAIQWLESAIKATEKNDFSSLDAFVYMAMVYLSSGKTSHVAKVTSRIKKTNDAEEFLDYAGRRMASIGLELMKNNRYSHALEFLESARALISNNEDINKLYEDCLLPAHCQEEWEHVQIDPNIISPLVKLVSLNITTSFYKDVENVDEIFEDIVFQVLNDYGHSKVLRSLEYLHYNYFWISQCNPDTYDHIRKVSTVHDQYNRVIQDSSVTNAVQEACVHYVSLYLNLPTSEAYLQGAMQKMQFTPPRDIHASAIRIRDNYSSIYQLNWEFFDKLITQSEQNIKRKPFGSTGCILPIMVFGGFLLVIITMIKLI
ncbi:MAG TPA: tetratricopeptide repeat protein [Natronincola sp.]|nr:tetratricopeptide repeat protein [Natronincola sp.]